MGFFASLKEIFGISAPSNRTPTSLSSTSRNDSLPSRGNELASKSGGNRASITADPLEGKTIIAEYVDTLRLLNAGCPLVFVTGEAGTGKTTLIHYIRQNYVGNTAVVAPTGVAALNIKGVTVHSFFQFPPRYITKNDIKQVDRKEYKKLDLLVVDEVSMLRAEMLDGMDKFLRLNGRDESRPFGGTQLLIVGDLHQLPPVVPPEIQEQLWLDGYDSQYFFSAHCLEQFDDTEFQSILLTKGFRQSDSEYLALLGKVRVAEDIPTVTPRINSRCLDASTVATDTITLTRTNNEAELINNRKLGELPGEVRKYVGETTGKYSDHQDVADRLPSPKELQLKIDAQVMFTKNDDRKRWVNGTLGRVKSFHGSYINVEIGVDAPDVVVDVQKVVWEKYAYKYNDETGCIEPIVVGTFTQYPLILAWGITIHKSQGKTLSCIHLDLGNSIHGHCGDVYVALSRCRSLNDVTISRPLQVEDIKCDQVIKDFYSHMAKHQQNINLIITRPTVKCEKTVEPPNKTTSGIQMCPKCGSRMTRRTGRYGPFWGCSRYPDCKGTAQI